MLFGPSHPELVLRDALQPAEGLPRGYLETYRRALPPETIRLDTQDYFAPVVGNPFGFAINLAERFIATADEQQHMLLNAVVIADDQMDYATRRRKREALGSSIDRLFEVPHSASLYLNTANTINDLQIPSEMTGLVVIVEPKTPLLIESLRTQFPNAVFVVARKEEQEVKFHAPETLHASMKEARDFARAHIPEFSGLEFEEVLYRLYVQEPYMTLEQIAGTLGKAINKGTKTQINAWLRECGIQKRETNQGHAVGATRRWQQVQRQARVQIESAFQGVSLERALATHSDTEIISRNPGLGNMTIQRLREETGIAKPEVGILHQQTAIAAAKEKRRQAIEEHRSRVVRAIRDFSDQLTRGVTQQDIDMLRLRYIKGMSWAEIAQQIGVADVTVRRHVGQLVMRAERITARADIHAVLARYKYDDQDQRIAAVRSETRRGIMLYGSIRFLERVRQEVQDKSLLATFCSEIVKEQRRLGDILPVEYKVSLVELAEVLIPHLPRYMRAMDDHRRLQQAIDILKPL